jgi:FkbM family methyltransferase
VAPFGSARTITDHGGMKEQEGADFRRWAADVDRLLAEPLEHAVYREARAWHDAQHSRPLRVVIHGAGQIGRRALDACRRLSIPVEAFCDRLAERHSVTHVDGVPVMTVKDAAQFFGRDCTFLAAIWSGTSQEGASTRMEHLRKLGCRHVLPFPPLFWACAGKGWTLHGLAEPSYFIAHAEDIRWLARLLRDSGSLRVLASWLRRGVLGEFCPDQPSPDQYFAKDVLKLKDEPVIVDVGAYRGDTLSKFLDVSGSRFRRYHAFEPDARSCSDLTSLVNTLPLQVRDRITVHCLALGCTKGKVRYLETGSPRSMLSNAGGSEVEINTLDSVLGGNAVDFIKIDVEGFEADVLDGARDAISTHAPSVAACVYHRPDDFWVIARRLHAMLPNHQLSLRTHGYDGWETVLYAVADRHSPDDRSSA